ncbi:MAG: hypothetical protein ACRDNS_18820 [Trebonia sp.]
MCLGGLLHQGEYEPLAGPVVHFDLDLSVPLTHSAGPSLNADAHSSTPSTAIRDAHSPSAITDRRGSPPGQWPR